MAVLSNSQKAIQRVKKKKEKEKQGNTFQIKKQNIFPETDISETEISDLTNKEFKIMVIKMLTTVREKCMNKIRIQ